MEVNIQTDQLVNELKTLQRRGSNLKDVNNNLAEILLSMVEDKFEDEGPGWPPLADSTLRRRRASKSPKMLQDTADMVNSLQPSSGADYAEVFTNKVYASYHIEGNGVPKRDFFDVDTDKALETFGLILLEEISTGQ